MGWASRYIEKIRAGETVSFRPHGQSMTGHIEPEQLCTVVPHRSGGVGSLEYRAVQGSRK